jgi:hypothetical protein
MKKGASLGFISTLLLKRSVNCQRLRLTFILKTSMQLGKVAKIEHFIWGPNSFDKRYVFSFGLGAWYKIFPFLI